MRRQYISDLTAESLPGCLLSRAGNLEVGLRKVDLAALQAAPDLDVVRHALVLLYQRHAVLSPPIFAR
jgi:hypothetical protein